MQGKGERGKGIASNGGWGNRGGGGGVCVGLLTAPANNIIPAPFLLVITRLVKYNRPKCACRLPWIIIFIFLVVGRDYFSSCFVLSFWGCFFNLFCSHLFFLLLLSIFLHTYLFFYIIYLSLIVRTGSISTCFLFSFFVVF